MAQPHAPITRCKECGSSALTWHTANLNRSDVQQGRLRTGDIECVHFLGCDDCSETLVMLRAEQLADMLNAKALQVRREGGQRVIEVSDHVLDVVWQIATTAAHNRVADVWNARVGEGNSGDVAEALGEAMARITDCLQADAPTLQQLRQILAAAPVVPAADVAA